MQRQTIVSRSYQYSYSMRLMSRIVLSRRLCTRSRRIRNFLERTEVAIYLLLLIISIIIVSIVKDINTDLLSEKIISFDEINTNDVDELDIVPIYNITSNLSKEVNQFYNTNIIINDSMIVSKSIQDIIISEEINNYINTINIQLNKVKTSIIEESAIDADAILNENLGNDIIDLNGIYTLQRYDLPDKYYPGIDYSSFQPYMSYELITDKDSSAYEISHSENAYTDQYGLRRYKTSNEQFTINGEDDYIVALGTFYKEKGICGSRYLIVTTTGMFTVITGDEKSDIHTDEENMFSLHKNGTCAGMIEWIVDTDSLESTMKRSGTITAGPVTPMQGEIIHIYGIN